jgi:quercetin dioxygenase-like cupin family protein
MTNLIPKIVQYFGFSVVVYDGMIGEGVPQHSHPNQHGLVVLSGTVFVRVDGLEDRQITKEHGMIYLPPILWHELEIVSDTAQFLTLFATEV